MNLFDPDTLQFYSAEAPVYSASGNGGINRHLDAFLDLLPQGASILELGCGGGRDAAHMIARGFDVDATDGTPELAAKAAERLGRKVRVMCFHEIDAIERYDAIYASASLLHIPREGLPAILSALWRALRPGGWHFASYKGGGVEGRDIFGRYFNYLSAAQGEFFYRSAGDWDRLQIEEGLGGGYDGVQGPWIWIWGRKGTT